MGIMSGPQSLTLKAYAKINLTLEVLGRREDGYHDIASIMQAVDLCDTLSFEPADELMLECDVPELATDDNLVLRAARMLREESGYESGARVSLEKCIPSAAGLGGGSSDAAATFVGLNELWGLGLTVEELTPLAARVGSDVPFFLHGGTAMALGRGERIRSLPPIDLQWLVLLAPSIDVPDKTASMYGLLSQSHMTRGALTRKLEARIRGGGDAPPQFFFNAFDDVAFKAYPELEKYWNTLDAMGAREIHLAGSGPSIFAPVSRREFGTALHLVLKHRHGWEAFLVSTVGHGHEVGPS
jgi:4-diphosphocytidyl-2-C-methyl-D-erythritol kinase